MPAGNIEKLKYAIKYGADAVYLGVVDFSLRAMRKGELITLENLKYAIDTARELGAKAYLTLNIFGFNNDIKALESCMDRIVDSNPDALIISDPGIMRLAKKYMPDTDIHVSTQANILNYEAVRFWQDMGATRAILARELPIKDVAEIKSKVPDMELECFIHGAQCVSFSGRCLLSDYMTDGERKANSGNCSQPCRWSYKLVEETRPGQYQEIVQDDKGTHILSTKDLCLVKHLKEMIEAGIDSFKVEGRTKSLYYVSAVAKAYREAIDTVMKTPDADMTPYYEELLKVGNRGYTTGFYLGEGYPKDGYSYDISKFGRRPVGYAGRQDCLALSADILGDMPLTGQAPQLPEECSFRSPAPMSVPELIMLLEDALRGRYGGIVRAKGILETGGGYVRFDLADGLYSITGADGVSTEPQCVFIGRQLRPAEIAARLADPAAFI